MSKYATQFVRVFGALALVVAFVATAVSTNAVSNLTSVVNSGDDADVDTDTKYKYEVVVSNSNYANVNQNVNANSNTGGNKLNGNIASEGGGNSLTTGDASVVTTMGVQANSNVTAVEMPSMAGMMNATELVNTGDDADVDTDVSVENKVSVFNKNKAFVNQGCGTGGNYIHTLMLGGPQSGCDANTGKNTASGNIGDATMTTGNAGVATEMMAAVNSNQTVVGGGDDDMGALLNQTTVTNTGDDADVDTDVTSKSKVKVANYNFGVFNQFVNASANTGKNSAKKGIGGTDMTTGDAGVLSAMEVEANTNVTGVSGSALGPMSVNVFDIVNTGDDFDGDADSETEVKTKVKNGGYLNSYQSLMLHSETGYNYVHGNVGTSSVGTGSGATGSSLLTGGNSNMTVLGSLGMLLSLLAL